MLLPGSDDRSFSPEAVEVMAERKIELSAECVRILTGTVERDDKWASKSKQALDEARTALAKHEAEQNPLCTPWEIVQSPCCLSSDREGTGGLRDSRGRPFAYYTQVARLPLIAHAPKLAECLDTVSRLIKPAAHSARWTSMYDHARAILEDAGWPTQGKAGTEDA